VTGPRFMGRLVLSAALLACAGATANDPAAPAPFTTDGCSWFPDRGASSDWCHCCLAHDLVYWRGGTAEERLKADQDLQACVRAATQSQGLATLMFFGVRTGGGPHLNTSFRWGYGWPYGRGYKALSPEEAQAADRLEAEYRATNPSLRCEAPAQ
jgi:hypothetical protein